ncbi:EAL domain-containing protein [Paenibacillus sp. J5C_2022]|uniref:putative bifunctional diguanylate cyclase/phosphodiesterase n=1 Tax=Paenibacillus sp. J5C2022 TaxID=2977129 RepID=UPI0021D0A356|nr:EAL domain-containing protein [Paenibacillus sp. J5C2022]MCU6710754.1 EAL domain-containing protein [Paenibacillus sp. J5C2022]
MYRLLELSRHKGVAIAAYLACLALALLAQWISIPFLFGASLTLTSVFLYLSVRLFGLRGGLPIAFAAHAVGIFLLEEPLFFLIGLLETVAIGLLLRKFQGRLFYCALLFWLPLGMAVLYLFLLTQDGTTTNDALLISCIITVNSVANALFAEIIDQCLPIRSLIRSTNGETEQSVLSLRKYLLYFTIGIVMILFLLNIFVNSVSSFKEIHIYTKELAVQAVHAVEQERLEDASQGLEQIRQLLGRYDTDMYIVSILDSNRKIIASSDSEAAGHIGYLAEASSYIKLSEHYYLTRHKQRFSMWESYIWHNESFVYVKPIEGIGHMIVDIPLENYREHLFNKYLYHFAYLFGFTLAAALAALLINRLIVRDLNRLAQSTADLPHRLKQQHIVDLPASRIKEIDGLIANIRFMSGSLLQLFRESQSNAERLAAQAQLLRQSEERLHQLAYYDSLTGLPNRLHFSRQFSELIALSRPDNGHGIAILLIDINRFKQINDALGHSAGDSLLRQVGTRLDRLSSKENTLFRLGGDEFVFLCSYTQHDQLTRFAQSICRLLEEPFLMRDLPLFLTVSIGISIYPQDGPDTESVLSNADIAMYNAKKEGDGSYRFFASGDAASMSEKLRLENGLYKALQDGHFSLYYQPKVYAATGELCGIEALIRWHHPELGMIPPDKFIPLAEESGFILEIDRYVFREACRQNKAWQDAGYKPIPVSINISARHFYQGDLKAMITEALNDTGLSPQYVSLEITEGVFMRQSDHVIETIVYLRGLGIQISIDDFGTGFSSLNQLQWLPISDVKLDRSFIRGITNDDKKSSIVKAIIELVHSMNMKVVAEGVETVEESQYCKMLKCDELQGYLFSKPLTAADLEERFLPIRL